VAKAKRRRAGTGTERRGHIDDPARLAREARENVEKSAAELRKQRLPIATEPPTVYRP